jgi:hypothetical protein
MQTVRMKALKPMRLNSRKLVAGTEFDVSPRKGRVLRTIGKAEYFTVAEIEQPAPADFGNLEPSTMVGGLADEYRQLTGREPDGRWREKRIRDEIAAALKAKGSENA